MNTHPLAAVLVAAAAFAATGCATSGGRPADGRTTDLVVVSTTDVHGWLRGWNYFENKPDDTRGLARVATIVDSVRAANPGRVLLVDAGDLLQGNPLAFVAARVAPDTLHPVIAAMNAMAYDAAAVGNHEFNYGLPTLERALAKAAFPFLAANAYAPSGTRAFPAYRIVDRAGLRVGIVGATNPGAMLWDQDHLRSRLVIRDIVASVREAVAEARSRGAEVIVVTVHSGLTGQSSYDTVATGIPSENVGARLAREVEGIDAIVVGHSHRELADTVIGRTLVVQPRNWATSVSVARLTLVNRGGRWETASKSGTLVRAVGHAESPVIVAAVERAHLATVEYVNRPVGTTAVAWRADSARVVDTPLIDFILEVERRASGADLASTAAFSLDAALDAGPITVAELARLYPYDNTLRAVRVSGRQLREYLEFSARYYRQFSPGTSPRELVDASIPGYNFDIIAGAEYVLDLRQPIGERVTELRVKGKPVTDADTFSLALNNYRQTGGGGYAMLQGAPLVYDRQIEIRQLLIEEVERRGSLNPADYFTPNWRLEPTEAVSVAYAATRGNTAEREGGPVAAPRAPPAGSTVLRIIATNDFHGALEPRPDTFGVRRGGAAHVATVISRARSECKARRPRCVSILLDGGDMFQGTPASNLSFGTPVVEMYNTLDYSAAALGNHEFDWGRDTLRRRMRDARFPVLGANVRYDDGRDVEWIPNDTIVTRDGVRVGIIGLATTETPRATRAANVAGLRFLDPAPVVNEHARTLRQRGAEAVVVIAHAGGFCRGSPTPTCTGEIFDLAHDITERVDAIVSGHSHSLVRTVVNGIPIVQSRSRGSAVGVIDLALGGERWAAEPQVRDVLADSVPADPRVDSLVRRAVSVVAERMSRPVAQFATPIRRGTPQGALGQFIADAQRAALKADVAVMNHGGIRADVPAGPATYGTFFEVHPFGNTLVRYTLRGSILRAYLERLVSPAAPNAHVSGVTITHAPAKPVGSRLLSAQMADGQPLDDARTYTLVINDFMATGGDGLSVAGDAIKVEDTKIVDLDALVAYARSLPQPIRFTYEPRLIAALP